MRRIIAPPGYREGQKSMLDGWMQAGDLEAAFQVERARLVRLCARLTGNWDAAEDLAQETLLEAWRSLARLRDADGLAPWLTAIARNVCLRWMRSRGRGAAPSIRHPGDDGAASLLEALPAADEGELTIVLERDELAELLDRALALLPAATRDLLLAHYIHELPQVELAARLGMSEGALRVRLHRGKLALRRVLTTELREDAAAFGLGVSAPDAEPAWSETRIWCPFCGRHRLQAYFDRRTGDFAFRCAGSCLTGTSELGSGVGSGEDRGLLAELASPKSILTRICLILSAQYREILARGSEMCPYCGRVVPVRLLLPDSPPQQMPSGTSIPPAFRYGLELVCPDCKLRNDATAWHLTLDTRAAQRFWRRHPRMRALPVRELDAGGRPALLTGFESLDGHARLEVLSTRDTYEVLHIEGEGER
jgi:RNA polymerase sigma factor (sigma-70 family)